MFLLTCAAHARRISRKTIIYGIKWTSIWYHKYYFFLLMRRAYAVIYVKAGSTTKTFGARCATEADGNCHFGIKGATKARGYRAFGADVPHKCR